MVWRRGAAVRRGDLGVLACGIAQAGTQVKALYCLLWGGGRCGRWAGSKEATESK